METLVLLLVVFFGIIGSMFWLAYCLAKPLLQEISESRRDLREWREERARQRPIDRSYVQSVNASYFDSKEARDERNRRAAEKWAERFGDSR